jgi:hypothetical protein
MDKIVATASDYHRFIKMDIEGAERNALRRGATLKTFKPRTTIASYHLPDDVWRFLLSCRPRSRRTRCASTVSDSATVI